MDTQEFCTKMQRLEDERDPVGAQTRKDAARYRWLRDTAYHATAGPNGKMVWCVTGEGCSTEEPIYGEALDAAIDATLKTPNVKVSGCPPHETNKE